jgi:hypothetical protein
LAKVFIGALLVTSIGSCPHHLAFFNVLAGGPRYGHEHLLHSNLDWGQDLTYLIQWRHENPNVRPFYVAYYGFVDPVDVGLDLDFLPFEPNGAKTHLPHGCYAVSVNLLAGGKSGTMGTPFIDDKLELLRRRFPDWPSSGIRAGPSIVVLQVLDEQVSSIPGDLDTKEIAAHKEMNLESAKKRDSVAP